MLVGYLFTEETEKFMFISEKIMLDEPITSENLKRDHQLPLAKQYNFLLTLATHNAEDVDNPKVASTIHGFTLHYF